MRKCEECENPGVLRSALGRALVLCEQCYDRAELREAMNKTLPELVNLTNEPERAFALLEEMRITYAMRDHDGWLDRSLRGHKAFIFSQNGRQEEALLILQRLAGEFSPGTDDHLATQAAIAVDLEALGRFREALEALENGLNVASGRYVLGALTLFDVYARIADQLGEPVPSTYRGLFDEVMRAWGIEVPEELYSRESLSAAVTFASEGKRAASRRHRRLRNVMQRSPESERAKLLNQYIEEEQVGFYRDMARRELEDMTLAR